MITERMDWLTELEEKVRNNTSKYDIIVPVSGGKDGTFLLWYICTHTKLRVLAYHIDNWFVSKTAERNVKEVCKELGCDCEVFTPDWKASKKLFRELLYKNGEICIACEMMISLYPMVSAIEKKIPYMVWGLTPVQIKSKKINSGYKDVDYQYYKKIEKYYEKLIEMGVDESDEAESIKNKLLYNQAITEQSFFPSFVMPFYWLGYDANTVEKTVKENTCWERPVDAGGTSSNCLINQLHIYLKKCIKGKEFYEQMMEKKYEAGEVSDAVKQNALEDNEENIIMRSLLDELDIDEGFEELVDRIKNCKKNIYLKMESNISQ